MGRRKALCIGCNYPGTKSALNGCVNDAATNVQLCVNKLGVPANEIMVLTDADCPGVSGHSQPTKQNILSSMKRLVTGAQAGDMLFLSYSGHGTQVPDRTGEEADGMDEAIVPTDYESTGRVITDDELYAYLVKPLPEGVLLTCIFDCCHAGTILDLDSAEDSTGAGAGGSGKRAKAGKKKYKKGKGEKELAADFAGVGTPKSIPGPASYEADEIPEAECLSRGMGGPAVFCYSGCRDDQTSLDVTLGGKPCGALTNALQTAFSAGGEKDDYETLFRNACGNLDQLRKRCPSMTQCPQMSYTDAANPSSVNFCSPSAGGYDAAYPVPAKHSDKPPKEGKKPKKQKEQKEKKEKAPKAAKEKKEKKPKGGKSKDIDVDSDESEESEDEHQRKAEMGKHMLAAAFGRF